MVVCPFVLFLFGHCVVCSSSIYRFWLPPFGIIKLFLWSKMYYLSKYLVSLSSFVNTFVLSKLMFPLLLLCLDRAVCHLSLQPFEYLCSSAHFVQNGDYLLKWKLSVFLRVFLFILMVLCLMGLYCVHGVIVGVVSCGGWDRNKSWHITNL
jgi:hypothetical protein